VHREPGSAGVRHLTGLEQSSRPHVQAETSPTRDYPPSRTAERDLQQPAAAPEAEVESQFRISSMTVMIGIGALIVVIAVVWAVAFQMGEKNRDRELGNLGGWKPPEGETGVVPPAGISQVKAPAPIVPRKDGSGNAARTTETPKPPAAEAGADPRVPGFNYLYLCSLTLKDANAAVDFLKRNGVQAFHVFDRQKPSGNNPLCRIYASQGFAGGALFRESQKERDELVRRVEELGKKWQREEKGPSDFRQPLWALFKGQ